MGQSYIGAQIAADHDIVPGGEGAWRPVVPNGQNRRERLAHRRLLYGPPVTTQRVRV